VVEVSTDLPDGTYQVDYSLICAGFVVRDGRVIAIAPVLRRGFHFWQKIAKRISDNTIVTLL
jgi:hypothetical protein